MHREILIKEQIKLLPLVGKFVKNFGLVGGTAIALQIGHRRSIDFDLFTFKHFDNARIREVITKNGFKIGHTRKDEIGQFTFLINEVQFTFFHYPQEAKKFLPVNLMKRFFASSYVFLMILIIAKMLNT